MSNKPTSEAILSIISSCLAVALGVTQFITIIVMNWVTLSVLLKSDLDVKQAHLRGGLVDKKFMLSCRFRCDQIQQSLPWIESHFVALLKSDLDIQQTQFSLLIISSYLALALSVTKFKSHYHKFIHTFLCHLSPTYMLNKPTTEAVYY